VDEAHHMLPFGLDAGAGLNIGDQPPAIFVTVHPDALAASVLRSIGIVLIIGKQSLDLIETLSARLGRSCPQAPERGPEIGEAVYWDLRTDNAPVVITVDKPAHALKRHIRKYAEGTLGEDRSFYFTGPSRTLHLRAQNLLTFLQIGDGVDETTYRFHLANADFSTWLRKSIKDDDLADEVAQIEAQQELTFDEARRLIRTVIERRYTKSADAP
jgi:hypothetical protein